MCTRILMSNNVQTQFGSFYILFEDKFISQEGIFWCDLLCRYLSKNIHMYTCIHNILSMYKSSFLCSNHLTSTSIVGCVCQKVVLSKLARYVCAHIRPFLWLSVKVVPTMGQEAYFSQINSFPPGHNGHHFGRRCFEMHFYEWKALYFDLNFTEVCSKGSNWQ